MCTLERNVVWTMGVAYKHVLLIRTVYTIVRARARKGIAEGEVYAQDYKMPRLVHLNSQGIMDGEATECRLNAE